MKFSVVICTYNRAPYLAATLESIAAQDFSLAGFEVVVVDNNSPDHTAEVCSAFQVKNSTLSFRYIMESEQGISFARNRGVQEAHGEYIVFIDDDETIDTFYLSKLSAYLMEYPDARLCATAVLPVYETEKPAWLSHYTMRLVTGYYYKGEKVKKLGVSEYPGTGHAIICKELFEHYGYFNTELGRKGSSLLGAEDKDMFLRLIENNVACYYLPGIPVYHHIPAAKLSSDFFHRLTYSIGKSERIRTLSISRKTYLKRLFSESIKWAASIVLFFWYNLTLHPSKGVKLLQFRWNVSHGLLGL